MSKNQVIEVDPLAAFAPATATWFREVFAEPTAAQAGAWGAISAGENALVIAPTGSGKTLAAFLWALDGLTRPGRTPGSKARDSAAGGASRSGQDRCRVLYVSPLKALAVDVERNLRAPLAGISRTASRLDQPMPSVEVGVRSGDTSPAERRKLAGRPPDIMITTPESLFLMLTSSARDILRHVETVIVDEVHALAGTKRGAHLAVSLERLDALIAETAVEEERPGRPAQRIGLSATVRPPERVARFLGGPHPVRVVAPPAEKRWDLQIVVPVEDMTDLAAAARTLPGADQDTDAEDDPLGDLGPRRAPSIWPHVENQILDVITAHRSTIVFANSRRLAERLTTHLNELYAERLGFGADEAADGADLSVRPNGPPAQVMAQSGASSGRDGSDPAGPPVVARAHHGSVSKEQRAVIEAELKSGLLPCVVATSSLELGIDMGAVDVVVQVESPPSVASGLQRVGRAGHQVGAVSEGVFFPNHRGDLVESAVVVERMRAGAIEEVAELHNPLDVLAQQVVAIASGGEQSVEELFALFRRASSFADLPYSAFEAVLDMLSGRYPSEDFAELRPRLVWRRDTGTVTARPGAQRLAVTSGGTIPDRGLFGVFLVGEGSASGRQNAGRRVGELDEEMVYESRVGDVFTLGTTSWRIEQITHDQVLVSPAPGLPGRLPFWKGDAPGRPVELGMAYGTFVGELGAMTEADATVRLRTAGLDPWAATNLVRYLAEQQQATQALPTDTTIVVERFRDELGDWRVCLHSPLGSAVLAPWALAIEHTARERYGLEVHATATNDGIVLRVPDTESEPPGADLVIIDPERLEEIVTDEVGGSALFAARFRECAARALLLPRRDPKARSPLWQQRMRSAQLLTVAAQYPEFPIVLETMRECLTDVFDLEGLLALQRRIASRAVRLVEVETREASPFAASLLFGYLGSFVYEGDVPLAEKKAAALSLDPQLLAELLGKDGLQQLLDDEVIASTEADLQGLSESRRAKTAEQLFDLVRTAGPFRPEELTDRCLDLDPESAVDGLVADRRLVRLRVAGAAMVAVTEDVPRLRDGLGVPVPPGVAASAEPVSADPVGDLVLRWARTHGPFESHAVAHRYGLGTAVVDMALDTLVRSGQVTAGSFVASPASDRTDPGSDQQHAARTGGGRAAQYCHSTVLALIKRRTLAALRKGVEPVDQVAFARFLPEWQGVGGKAYGVDAVAGAIEQLAGYALPASAVEAAVLPARVADYQPGMLDELTSAGDVFWIGDGPVGESDGWVRFYPAGEEPPAARSAPTSALARELLETFESGGAYFFDRLLTGPDALGRRADYVAALWELVWSGHLTGDTFAPVRALTSGGGATLRRPRRAPRARLHRSSLQGVRRSATPRIGSPTTAGRWSAVPRSEPTPRQEQARRAAEVVTRLERYGVLTRGSVLTEDDEGGFGPAYRALSTLEESGQCRRGYFVDGLGAAQFGLTGAIDRIRDHQQEPEVGEALVLAACDPANPYGAALPWPEREGHRPGRKAGALVVTVAGHLVFYLERGGRTLLSFTDDAGRLAPGAAALAAAVRRGVLGRMTVERADGEHVFSAPAVRDALQQAGFQMTPQGLRLRSA